MIKGYENHLTKLASALKSIGYDEQAAMLVKLAEGSKMKPAGWDAFKPKFYETPEAGEVERSLIWITKDIQDIAKTSIVEKHSLFGYRALKVNSVGEEDTVFSRANRMNSTPEAAISKAGGGALSDTLPTGWAKSTREPNKYKYVHLETYDIVYPVDGKTHKEKEKGEEPATQSYVTANDYAMSKYIPNTTLGNQFRGWARKSKSSDEIKALYPAAWSDKTLSKTGKHDNQYIGLAWKAWGDEWLQTKEARKALVAAKLIEPEETTGGKEKPKTSDEILISYLRLPASDKTTERDKLKWQGKKPPFDTKLATGYVNMPVIKEFLTKAYGVDGAENALAFDLAEIGMTEDTADTDDKKDKTKGGTAPSSGDVRDFFWAKKDNTFMRKSDGALFYAARTDQGMALKPLHWRRRDPNEDGENALGVLEQKRMLDEVRKQVTDKALVQIYKEIITGASAAVGNTGVNKEKNRAAGYKKMQGAQERLKKHLAGNKGDADKPGVRGRPKKGTTNRRK